MAPTAERRCHLLFGLSLVLLTIGIGYCVIVGTCLADFVVVIAGLFVGWVALFYFQQKLTTWLVREYDAVFVEDLDVKPMLEESHNARNKQDAAWRQFITILEYKAELYGVHVVQVEPHGMTKECASCGVETKKPIWVREHSCPSCGFECDRDANAALNVLQRGFSKLGLGWPESTPVETALPTDTRVVSAKHVIETGSPTLNEAKALA